MDELKQTKDDASLPVEMISPRYAQQMDQQMDADLKTMSRFFLKHPSLALTFAYLTASIMGLIFTISLLDEFQFNALPYLELTDFLLAAISHPATVLALSIGIFAVVLATWFERKCRTKYLKYAAWVDDYYRSWLWLPNWFWLSCIFVGYLWVVSTAQAPALSHAIKTHQKEQFQLSLIYPIQPGGKEVRQLNEVQIITRTVSYLWIYHQDLVKLIPHANVAALIPVPPKKPDEKAQLKTTEKIVGKADKPAVTEQTPLKQPSAVPVKN